jgi:hypothetical protein
MRAIRPHYSFAKLLVDMNLDANLTFPWTLQYALRASIRITWSSFTNLRGLHSFTRTAGKELVEEMLHTASRAVYGR